MTHPYLGFVQEFARMMDDARALPFGGFSSSAKPCPRESAPEVLLFSPHPDDESIVGALPLRLHRELGHHITAVAVTQGSQADQQAQRLEEMHGACAFLGFELLPTRENGLTNINPKTRASNPLAWAEAVALIARILETTKPDLVFIPHAEDWNTTHQGTHFLVMDALQSMESDFNCLVVETEFWGPMANPNLMIESTPTDVADLVAAVSFHRGEVTRNPYHLRLLAWMSDNVRRGGELVGGQGRKAPDFHFATLYRAQAWTEGKLEPFLPTPHIMAAGDNLASVFPIA